MLTIKHYMPFKKLSRLQYGLSAKSYLHEMMAVVGRRIDALRARYAHIGRKSLAGAGALLVGFFGSIYILFALQPHPDAKVATPAAKQPASQADGHRTTPAVSAGTTGASSTSQSPAPVAASPVAGAPSTSQQAAPRSMTSSPSLVSSAPAPATSSPATAASPTSSTPTVQPGMGSSTPSAPAPSTSTSPTSTVTQPVTELQQTVLPQSQPVTAPVTKTVDNLAN